MKRTFNVALAASALFLSMHYAALAADGAGVSGSEIASFVMPTINAIVSALVIYAFGWLFVLAKNKLGLSIDDSMRKSIQTAATNAAGLVLNNLGNTLSGKTISVGNPFIAQAVDYVLRNAPDAIAHFGLTPDSIAEKIIALLPQVANTTVTSSASA